MTRQIPEAMAAPPPSTAPLVTLSHVDVQMWTGGTPTTVLHDVSLSVMPGERVHIVGPRASGKTILMRTIAGILSPARGEQIVSVPCLPLLGAGVTYDATLSLHDNLLWHLTGWGHCWSSDFPDFVRKIVAMSGISQSHDFGRPESLDSGEQLRLLTAAALYMKPRIFLIDSVDEHIDPHFAEWFSEQVSKVRLDESGVLIAAGDWARSIPNLLTRRIQLAQGRIEND